MPEDETRSEEMERLQDEIEDRKQRLRRLRREEIRSGDGLTVEEFEDMSPDERRKLKRDDPELWEELQTEKRRRGEEALGVKGAGGPLTTKRDR